MDTRPPARISRDLTVRLVTAERDGVDLPAALRYEPGDPYAVEVVFHTGRAGCGDIAWTFARSLLRDGLHEPAGLGDVQVWREPAEDPVLCLALSSPSGTALFETDPRVVADFLADTYAAVPAGSEGERLDLDGALRALFSAVGLD